MHNDYKDEYPTIKQLESWFKQKSVDELSDIIISYIAESENEQNRWQLAMLNDKSALSHTEIKKMINKALPKKSVWEYRKVGAYFSHSDDMFAEIFVAIETLSAEQQWQHILYSLQRLNIVLEKVDDSGGFRFDLEGQLNQKLPVLFNQQTWSDDEKAQWVFEHYKEWQYDVFPSVPGDFSLTNNINDIFVNLCKGEADKRIQEGVDLSVWKEKWSLERLIAPSIAQAKENHDWLEQSRLMNMTAYQSADYIEISQLFIDKNETVNAEYWLQQAYKQAKNGADKLSCQKFEVQLRLGLKEYKQAWQLAWQLFTENPSFSGYEELIALEQKTGIIDADFKTKAEHVFNKCYVENSYDNIDIVADSLLSFYLYHHQLEEARLLVKSHKEHNGNLLKLADLIVSEHPEESVDLYYHVILRAVVQGNNQSYQHAIDLLIRLKNLLKDDDLQGRGELLTTMIGKVIKQHKAKRNMMKLLKTHFAECF
ncbi:MAG: hypothetical protein JJV99_07590 [Colwellia sp.]|nr:hypothetical protein [Colwellia sp.]